MVSKSMKEVDRYARDLMRRLLSECTEEQQKFFTTRMYPGGVEKISYSKMDNAFDQIERTIEKNSKGWPNE
jgi:hypothetical protein